MLADAVRDRCPTADIGTEGENRYWFVVAGAGPRSVRVHCQRGVMVCGRGGYEAVDGPDYSVAFRSDDEAVHWLRTESVAEAADAIAAWLLGRDEDAFLAGHPRVDRQSRGLDALREQIRTKAGRDVRLDASRSFARLECAEGPRSCRVQFLGRDETPTAELRWDDAVLATLEAGPDFAAVADDWLDGMSPSRMRPAHPNVPFLPLADFYEQGRRAEGEFSQSWTAMETFVRQDGFPAAAAGVLAELRRRGYDRRLRAGQSLWSILLSRSRRHGMRPDHTFVGLSFDETAVTVHVPRPFRDGGPKRWAGTPEAVMPGLCGLLDRLCGLPID